MDKYISYEQSGVSIDANDQMVQQIHSAVASTFGPRVIESRNAFAGMFRLDYDERLFKRNFKNPVLVACTDGVGSKVQLAGKVKKFDTVGIDLVAMCQRHARTGCRAVVFPGLSCRSQAGA
jgi:phosphoribosylformylglycinamidine cyclo-ligase